MKKMFSLAAMLLMAVGVFAGEKAMMKFDATTLKYVLKHKIAVQLPEKDGISITGDPSSKYNSWRAVSQEIPFKQVAGKQFTFGGMAKADIKSGRFQIAIREIGADRKTVNYQSVILKKSQDWKKFSKTFKARAKTVRFQFYIIGRKLDANSTGSVKGLYIEEK